MDKKSKDAAGKSTEGLASLDKRAARRAKSQSKAKSGKFAQSEGFHASAQDIDTDNDFVLRLIGPRRNERSSFVSLQDFAGFLHGKAVVMDDGEIYSFEFNDLNAVYLRPTKRTQVKREDKLDQIRQIFAEATNEEVDGLIAIIRSLMTPELPSFAPQLYEERQDKAQSAPDFVREVYGDYLDSRLTTSHLGKLDPKLRIALNNWSTNNKKPLPADLGLSSKAKSHDELSRKIPAGLKRELARIHNAITRRR
ncbi:MAG: hypothetical protein AAFY34_14685 [Pseudomonadota bacterium]